jgi:putative transposase
MALVLQPWQILVAAFAGWITREQDAVIEYLREENRVLKQQLGRRRLRLTDDQRRRLAVRGKAIGRRALAAVASIVTPDTILRWHRNLIAAKWTHTRRSPGRPRTMEAITPLILRMARENPRWGYTRIRGALQNLGHRVGRTTVAGILKENGLDPAPERGKRTTWARFLKTHWDVLAAADFFTVEVWAPRGLVTFYVFFVIELATRRIEIAGITPNPHEAWMMQIGRNLTDPIDGFAAGAKYLILDRDSTYSLAFRDLLKNAGINVVRLPPRSPTHVHDSRFIQTVGAFFGHHALRTPLRWRGHPCYTSMLNEAAEHECGNFSRSRRP